MGTTGQRFKAVLDSLKIDIKRRSKKLLLAAVILFSLSWSLVAPAKGVECFLFALVNKDKSTIVEEASNEPNYLGESTASGFYPAVNTLASLTNQPESSDASNQDLFFEQVSPATFQENALLSQTMPITFISQEPRSETITYLVQEGDSPSAIAASFGITTYTLLWANKLKETSIIRPGDELTILPVTGVLHRVKSGETISSIAKKYKAQSDDIIAFNDLPADGGIQIGDQLIIPDGQMPAPPQPTYIAQRSYVTGPGTGQSRAFPYGQCTWYVAQKRVIPWSGNAKTWLANAQAYGYQTGAAPQTGAVMVLTEGGWLGYRYGHVAYVEAVTGNWVTISEMNYNCRGCKSVRTLNVNDRRIRGYIY